MKAAENENPTAGIEQMSYEIAFSEFEQIVSGLESGEKTLEEALALYELGKKLAERCAQLLDQAEFKVKLLSGEELVDFE